MQNLERNKRRHSGAGGNYTLGTLLTVVIVMLSLPACTAERPRVGFILGALDGERDHRDQASFQATARELGAELVFRSAERVPEDQLTVGLEMLEDPAVDVLVLQPLNSEVVSRLTEACKARGEAVQEDRVYRGVKTLVVAVRPFDQKGLEDVVARSGFHTRQAIFGDRSP